MSARRMSADALRKKGDWPKLNQVVKLSENFKITMFQSYRVVPSI